MMGDVFQFLASVISTTVCETIISICVESCEQLWNCGIYMVFWLIVGAPTIQERLRGDIREAFVILLEKPFLQGECCYLFVRRVFIFNPSMKLSTHNKS